MTETSTKSKPDIGILIALDPTPHQEQMLRSHCGAARFAYNWCLDLMKAKREAGEKFSPTRASLRKEWNAVKDEVAPWWNQNSKEAYSYGCESAASAFQNFFDSCSGKRKGKKVGYPKYKSRNRSRMAYAYTTGSFGMISDDPMGLKFPRIGRIHTFENVHERLKRAGAGKICRMTVSFQHGRWFAYLDVYQKSISERTMVQEKKRSEWISE